MLAARDILLCLVWLTCWPVAAWGQAPDYDPTRYASYRIDPSRNATIEQITATPFTPLASPVLNPGYTQSAYWFRIQPPGDEAWLIEVQSPLLDHVDLFLPDGQGGYRLDAGGDARPFVEREIKHRNPVFRIPKDITAPVYLRIQSDGPMLMPIQIWRSDGFYGHLNFDEFGHGLYFGMMSIMVAYNLFLFFVVRDQNYLNYVLYIGIFVLSQAALNGYGLQYLWPNSPWMANHAQAFLVGAVIYAGSRFAHDFLDIPINLPSFIWPIRAMQWAALGIMAFTLVGPYTIAARLANYLGLILVLVVLPAGIVCAWRRYRPAYWFVTAWGLFLIGIFATGLTLAGLIPYQFITANAMQFGAALEVLLLSFALADRISSLRTDKELAQAEANRNLRRLNEDLETLVQARTSELTAANQALEVKNHILADIAKHDGLTGLLNHASFMALLSAQVEEAHRYTYPLSLMMIDIDYFKRINDNYGHQFGDTALAAVAKVLTQGKRVSDEAARYGGEEFTLILPHTELEAALRLAERLRHAVMAIRLDGADELILSASFGVAVIPETDTGMTRTN
ncbi:MAG: diguanylate cyclase [Hydrogenophilales bacterium]|nr:diguanylate cyclase [Hydrogenophilales bacterium]